MPRIVTKSLDECLAQVERVVNTVKIYGGTPQHDSEDLCISCRKATIIKGRSLNEEVKVCQALSGDDDRVRFKVTTCSSYDDKRMPSMYQLEDAAWILRTDPKKGKIGFVPASQVKPEEKHNY